ncbi:MAG: transcription elongation factor GreA [Bacillota bacterium]|nr:transcription elongation factor GreA [Bacillota bacterium]
MPESIKMTKEGLKNLEDELNYLVTVRRKEIAENIKQARDYGDLSENSEYDEAKNEQAVVEAKIQQLEATLKNVQVIDIAENAKVVNVGSKIKVLFKGENEEESYEIVGSTEADPDNNRISYESPVGKALMGAKAGKTVKAVTPSGIIEVKVLKIL